MAPLASGTPCCTTVARWCTDGAKAPAPWQLQATAFVHGAKMVLCQANLQSLQSMPLESMQSWCTDGAKAPALAANARTALYMVQVIGVCLLLCKPGLCGLSKTCSSVSNHLSRLILPQPLEAN